MANGGLGRRTAPAGQGAKAEGVDIRRLLLAEFAAVSLLICAGAVLGRLKMWQYMALGLAFVPCYMLNEWIVLEGGGGLLAPDKFLDTGGSIVIHDDRDRGVNVNGLT